MSDVLRTQSLGRTGLEVTRIGLGLAALGRPGYMTLGRDEDLPGDRTVESMQVRTWSMLDAAYDAGVRYFDAARSYGRAEAFLADWLARRDLNPGDVVVGSKWGYTYVADWKVDADVHEVKEHTQQRFLQQWSLSRQLLWEYLDVYQVHSATLDSGVLDDPELMKALMSVKAEHGLSIGLSLSGPGQAATLERALRIEVDGVRVFDTTQATWNPLESSVGPALLAAREEGMGVMVKESVANGRLTNRGLDTLDAPARTEIIAAARRHGVSVDAWAMAAALAQPWADVVLSGAVTEAQLASNLRALDVSWTDADASVLAAVAQPPQAYWQRRKAQPWR